MQLSEIRSRCKYTSISVQVHLSCQSRWVCGSLLPQPIWYEYPAILALATITHTVTTMSGTFTYTFDTPVYKGTSTIHTGLFINGEWVLPTEEKAIIEYF
ncbi:hypothetical protein FPV67DRAFT_1751998 [Lyophyllum atratum]|nr:hypothetical protein FPV67DRAFT_1751998 [Lyophyllum atratum]